MRIPAGAPLGLAAFEVVNSPYTGNVGSQVVYVSLGGAPTIASVAQIASTVTVNGSGFATGAVINLFNRQGRKRSSTSAASRRTVEPRIPPHHRFAGAAHLPGSAGRGDRAGVCASDQPPVHQLHLNRQRPRRRLHARRPVRSASRLRNGGSGRVANKRRTAGWRRSDGGAHSGRPRTKPRI